MPADLLKLEQKRRERELRRAAAEFEENARANATREAYRRDFEAFREWCEEIGFDPLPAETSTVVHYITDLGKRAKMGDLKASTIARRMVSIRHFHRQAGEDDPTDANRVREVWSGIRNHDDVQVAPDKASPLLREDIRAMVNACDETEMKGARDRAIILLGWFGFLRRGELVGLQVGDVEFHRGGAYLRIQQSKTDQAGEGQDAWAPSNEETPAMCPIKATRFWMDAAEVEAGPLFRVVGRWGNVRDRAISGRTVARVLKARAEQAGFEPEAIDEISGHSLRRGAAVQADEDGATVAEIQTAGRWKSPTMPLEYAKRGNLRRSSASNILAK